MLLLRAILALLALPALVGFALPIWLGTSLPAAHTGFPATPCISAL
jgi:hypothetical protein